MATPAPFPGPGVDVFESEFDAEIEVLRGPRSGETLQMRGLIDSAQSVARGEPFIDVESLGDHLTTFELPPDLDLPREVRNSDFPVIPERFTGTGDETIHLQITSLDARSADGQFRILAGQPLKREFPELFKPAFGMVVSDQKIGFPAKSFFVPYAVIVTPFGNLVSNEGRFAAPIFASTSISNLPPYGVEYVDEGPQSLVSADDLTGEPVAALQRLAHRVRQAPGA